MRVALSSVRRAFECAVVLVVDDDADTRETLCVILEAEGHECVSVGTGSQAIAACRERRFDCMLLDYSLGTMSGLAVAQRLGGSESVNRPSHVLLMTGHDRAEFSSAIREGLVDGYVQKPADLDKLVDMVRNSIKPPS